MRWLHAAVVLLIGWGLVLSFTGRGGPAPPRAGGGGSDLRLYDAITSQVSAGADYYATVATELPARGYATQSVLNYRLPTLTWINALLPSGFARRTPVAVLGFGVLVLWLAVVRTRVPKAATLGMPVLFMSLPVFLHPSASDMHELWAGLLIAGSLGVWSFGLTVLAIALGGAALFIRELAILYVVVMAGLAWSTSSRREAAGWILVTVAFAVFFLWHWSQVAALMTDGGPARSWLSFQGWSFVLATAHANPILKILPVWVSAIAVPLAWGGLWHWRDDLGIRLAGIVTAYFVLFLVAGRPDNWYWGLMISPLLPLGVFGWFARPAPAPSPEPRA